jgi:hypothetical protein
MLFHRLVLFGVFQALVAAGFALTGAAAPWSQSVAWWPVAATLTNLTSFFLLRRLAAAEGLSYGELVHADFQREHVGKDLLVLLGLLVLTGPVAMLPNLGLGQLFFGDAMTPVGMFIRPLPLWGVLLAVLFPLTIAWAELPTYFGYVMPRLADRWSSSWGALLTAALLLGLQHMTLPLIFDLRFILWRALMFIPFALLLGIAIRWRPRLLPYLMAVHVLIDLAVVLQLWQAAAGV